MHLWIWRLNKHAIRFINFNPLSAVIVSNKNSSRQELLARLARSRFMKINTLARARGRARPRKCIYIYIYNNLDTITYILSTRKWNNGGKCRREKFFSLPERLRARCSHCDKAHTHTYVINLRSKATLLSSLVILKSLWWMSVND